MLETLAYLYTSQAEIERTYSQAAAFLRTADGVENDILGDIIAEATDTVNLYLENCAYSYSDMANNSWIHRAATKIACYLLSIRAGNPAQYQGEYDRIVDLLDKVRTGKFQIPRLFPTDNLAPSVSNYRVDDRFMINKTRVQPSTQVGGSYPNQDSDPQYPVDSVFS